MSAQNSPARLMLAVLPLILCCRTAVAADVPYIVKPGENPWSISAHTLRSMSLWPRLVDYNRIAEPQRIPPGTVLRIPARWLAQRDRPASVLAVQGEVSRIDRSGNAVPLRVGDSVPTGSLIRTGEEQSVALGLADQSRVLVKGNSEFTLSSNSAQGSRSRDIRVDLKRGAMESDVSKRSSTGGRFEIRTPAAVAAVRGTAFRVVAGEARTATEVTAGGVALGNRAGRADVAAGFATAAVPNQAPQPPRALLPVPDLSLLPPVVERVPADLPIAALAGAGSYRTQIASDDDFVDLKFEQVTTLAVARVRDLPDGDYRLRVRGIDGEGFEGFDAVRRLTIHARPEPPFLIAPPDDAKLGDARPTFKWTRRQGDATYRFQLARDAAFADLVADRTPIAGDSVTLDDALPAGAYFWRVATVDARNSQGPFGEMQRLRRTPDAPAVAVASTDGKPAIRWRPGAPGERFQVQIARDPGFAAPQVDLTLADADAELPRLDSGTYHLRARTIAGDGYVGDWGTTQQFEIPRRFSPALLLLIVPVLLGL